MSILLTPAGHPPSVNRSEGVDPRPDVRGLDPDKGGDGSGPDTYRTNFDHRGPPLFVLLTPPDVQVRVLK